MSKHAYVRVYPKEFRDQVCGLRTRVCWRGIWHGPTLPKSKESSF